jgi:hypothetical protein
MLVRKSIESGTSDNAWMETPQKLIVIVVEGVMSMCTPHHVEVVV